MEPPIGAVLAGGAGRRLGGGKAGLELAGHPLIAYPLAALREVTAEQAVVVKPETRLPSLNDVAVWEEPPEPRHPLFGLLHALRQKGGRPLLVCAVDLPLVDASALRRLLEARRPGQSPAVVASAGKRIQPLLGVYEQTAAGGLAEMFRRDPSVSMTRAAQELGALTVEVPAAALFNVNTQEDLARAERLLRGPPARAAPPG